MRVGVLCVSSGVRGKERGEVYSTGLSPVLVQNRHVLSTCMIMTMRGEAFPKKKYMELMLLLFYTAS